MIMDMESGGGIDRHSCSRMHNYEELPPEARMKGCAAMFESLRMESEEVNVVDECEI